MLTPLLPTAANLDVAICLYLFLRRELSFSRRSLLLLRVSKHKQRIRSCVGEREREREREREKEREKERERKRERESSGKEAHSTSPPQRKPRKKISQGARAPPRSLRPPLLARGLRLLVAQPPLSLPGASSSPHEEADRDARSDSDCGEKRRVSFVFVSSRSRGGRTKAFLEKNSHFSSFSPSRFLASPK